METLELNNAYVGKNVRDLREELDLDLVHLSQRLEPLGIHLGKNALSKLETGGRKISVEELIALAIALEVTPNRLLLGDASGDDLVKELRVANKWTLTLLDAWQWAQGERYPDPESREGGRKRWQDYLLDEAFKARNQPHNPPSMTSYATHNRLQEEGVFNKVDQAIEELVQELGLSEQLVLEHIESVQTMKMMSMAARDATREDDDG